MIKITWNIKKFLLFYFSIICNNNKNKFLNFQKKCKLITLYFAYILHIKNVNVMKHRLTEDFLFIDELLTKNTLANHRTRILAKPRRVTLGTCQARTSKFK